MATTVWLFKPRSVLTLHVIHLVQNLSARNFFAKQAPTQKGMRTINMPRPKFGKVGSFFFSLSDFFLRCVEAKMETGMTTTI